MAAYYNWPYYGPPKGVVPSMYPYKGKGGPPGNWGFFGTAPKGPGGAGGGKGKGKSKTGVSPVEPAATELSSTNKSLLNTVEQLREANKALRAAATGVKAPATTPATKTPTPAALDKKAPWLCRTCGLDHHNGTLRNCRSCGAEREELATPGPSPTTVSARYWGPVQDKASQKLLKRLPMASAILVTPTVTAPPAADDELMEPSQEEKERQRASAQKTVEFLEALSPRNETLLKSAKEALAALSVPETKSLDKPGQERGLLIVLLDKQKAFNAEQTAKEEAAAAASCEKMLAAQEAHAALLAEHEAAATKRAAFVEALKTTVAEVEQQCFHECAETPAQAAEAATKAPGPAQTASRAEAASLLEYLQRCDAGGVGPPPACATLVARLQLLAGTQLAVAILDEDDDLPGTITPLGLPMSPTPNATEEVQTSSADAAATAREALLATKGANKGVPHPSGKGTGAGNGHAPY